MVKILLITLLHGWKIVSVYFSRYIRSIITLLITKKYLIKIPVHPQICRQIQIRRQTGLIFSFFPHGDKRDAPKISAKIATEEKARRLLSDVKDKQDVELARFKQAISALAAEEKSTVEKMTSDLATEVPLLHSIRGN